MYVIYALTDPRDSLVFYVGMTSDLYTRFIQHIKYEGDNEEKNKRIYEMQVLGLLPTALTLETCHSLKIAREREQHWISRYEAQNAPLTNLVQIEHKQPIIITDLRYELSASQIDAFRTAYKALANIDKALQVIGKGTQYRQHARRIIEIHGLREEA